MKQQLTTTQHRSNCIFCGSNAGPHCTCSLKFPRVLPARCWQWSKQQLVLTAAGKKCKTAWLAAVRIARWRRCFRPECTHCYSATGPKAGCPIVANAITFVKSTQPVVPPPLPPPPARRGAALLDRPPISRARTRDETHNTQAARWVGQG
jgi:hypothetical protein